jgi:hypothetical protein
MEMTRRRFASTISFLAWRASRSPLLHHVHDLAEFADLEPSLARDRMYLLAVLLNLVAVLGDEFLPAVCGELRSAIEPRYRLIRLTKPSARACTNGSRSTSCFQSL